MNEGAINLVLSLLVAMMDGFGDERRVIRLARLASL